jgi:hypothetical protein
MTRSSEGTDEAMEDEEGLEGFEGLEEEDPAKTGFPASSPVPNSARLAAEIRARRVTTFQEARSKRVPGSRVN